MTLHLPAKTCNNFAGPAKEFLHVVGMERPRALHRFLDPLEVALSTKVAKKIEPMLGLFRV